MKGIPTDDITYSEAELKNIKSKFKSSETIKQEFKDMKMNIQTDSEIMDDLFVRLQTGKSATQKMSANESDAIFEDLEYLLHQVDNALDFITKGGLDTLIIPNLANQTNTRLTILSLRLLAAITQNNPKAQIATFERNIGDHLIRILSNSKNEEEITAGIGAFGSLIRKFPLAQKELFRKSGFNALIHQLDEHLNLKVKLKTILLITDLMDESQEASRVQLDETETMHHTRIQQYKDVELEKHLNSSNFCEAIDEFFVLHRSDILDDIDVAEKVIHSLVIAEKCCYEVWSESPLFRHTLLVIKNNFDNRLLDASPDDSDEKDYIEHMIKQLGYLNDALYKHIVIKDEL
jgi:nucleotide exchange factor SIL1